MFCRPTTPSTTNNVQVSTDNNMKNHQTCSIIRSCQHVRPHRNWCYDWVCIYSNDSLFKHYITWIWHPITRTLLLDPRYTLLCPLLVCNTRHQTYLINNICTNGACSPPLRCQSITQPFWTLTVTSSKYLIYWWNISNEKTWMEALWRFLVVYLTILPNRCVHHIFPAQMQMQQQQRAVKKAYKHPWERRSTTTVLGWFGPAYCPA